MADSPQDVPDELLRRFDEEIGEATADALGEELGNSPRIVELTKAVMTDVTPMLTDLVRQVRERVAEEILADLAEREQRSPDGRPIAPPATPLGVRIAQERRKRAERDAEIARGGIRESVATESAVLRPADLAELLDYVVGRGDVRVVRNETLDRAFAALKATLPVTGEAR